MKTSILISICLALILLLVGLSAASATNYYVSLSGSDSDPGTEVEPWRHIDHAVDHVSAGDAIFVVPGNYSAEHVTITTSGTESNPIKITRYGTSGMITLKHDIARTGIGIRVYGNYWIIEHFDVSNYESDLYISGDYNTFNFVEAHDTIYGFSVSPAGEYNVFNECVSYDIRHHGWRLTGNYNLIKDCKAYDSWHFAISIDVSGGEAVGNIVDGGEYWGIHEDTAIVARYAFGTIIRNVFVHDTHDGIRTYFGNRNTTIENCTITNMTDRNGIAMYGSGIVRNNVIRNWNMYGIWGDGSNATYSENDMQDPSHPEYRFGTWRSLDTIGIIKNHKGSSFTVNILEDTGANEPATVIIEYTDGRTFSINGAGEYTTYTLNSIGTFNIEVIGGVSTGIISGIVKDEETDNPILGATATANGHSNNTNVSGYYEIQNITIGNYTVVASKVGYIDGSAEDVQVLDNQTTTVNFNLTALTELIGYWKFDEGTGVFANDSSGCNNNGSISGASWITGKLNSALYFDGINDYVQVTKSASLDSITSEITLEAWIRTPIVGTHIILARFLCGSGVNERAYAFKVLPDGKVQFGLCGDGSYSNSVWLTSNGTISPNIWTHVAATSDGTTMKIYINGKQDSNTAASPTGIHPSAGDLHIGRWLYSSPDTWYNPFNGTIEEVKIYSRALSSHEFYGYNISGYVKYENLTVALNVYITNNVTAMSNYTDANGLYNTNIPNGTYIVKADKFGFFSNSSETNISGADVENLNFTLGSYFADKIRASSTVTIYTNGTYDYSEEPIGKGITNWTVLPLNNEVVVNATDNSTVTVTSTGANQVWLNTTISAFANKEVQLIRNSTPVATTDANASGFISHLYIGGFSTYEFEYQAGSPPSGNVSGFIYSTDSNPIQDVVCYLSYTNGTYLAMVNTSVDGSYNFTNVESGDYYVFAKEIGISSDKSNVTVAANITTWVNMTLYREESPIAGQNVFVNLGGSFDFEADTLNFSCNRTDLFADFNTSTGKGNWTALSGTYAVKFGTSDTIGFSNKTIIFIVTQFNQSVKTDYWQYISQMESTAKYPYQLGVTLGDYVEYIVLWNETGQVWYTAWIQEWNNSVTDQVDPGDGFMVYFSQDNSFTRDNCVGELNWSFNTYGSGDWYNGSWAYRKQWTVTNVNATALTNYAAYINVTDELEMQSDWDDVVFTDSAGTKIPYELENYTTGFADYWVNVTIPASSSVTGWLYYGNDAAVSQENPEGVYDSHTKMVHHMQDLNDSTSNDNNATNHGATYTSSGQVDGAYDYNGSSDYWDCGNDASLNITDAITIEVWVKANSYASKGTSIIKYSCFGFYLHTDGTYHGFLWGWLFADEPSTSSISTDEWNHIVFSYDKTGAIGKIYKNGILEDSYSVSQSIPISVRILSIGRNSGNDDVTGVEYLSGTIDEVRIYNRTLSADEINQSYELVGNQSTWVSWGSAEPLTSYFLTGLDYNGTQTLSQINTSISNSNLSQLIYVNETGSDFIYTYGSAANGTIEVKQGQAFWVKVTGLIEKVRGY